MRRPASRTVVGLVVAGGLLTSGVAAASPAFEYESLDGSGNNQAHPDWGRAGTAYLRLTSAHYTDGIGAPFTGPSARYVSNRVFNNAGQRLSSPRGTSQWATAWGQFVNHTFAKLVPG